MALDRQTQDHIDVCRRQLPPSPPERKVVFGFDGVVDRVRTMLATRHGPSSFDQMDRIEELGTRITDAASLDTSCSIEWCSTGRRAGGHTAHLGRAMEQLGQRPTIIGTYGTPPHDTFTDEYEKAKLISIGPAPTTDAVEFDDGKVLLSDTGQLAQLDWTAIRDAVGINTLAASIDRTDCLGIGYWATIPQLPSVWDGLRTEVWPRLRDPPQRVLVDPADVRRLSVETLEAGVDALRMLDDTVSVVVSANRAEALVLARLFTDDPPESVSETARFLRSNLDVSEVVVHAVDAAASSSDAGNYRVSVPKVDDPELTTSAGDHFNAGLVTACLTDIDDGAHLVLGCAVAGSFVRTGQSPTYGDLLDFLDRYEALFTER